MIQVYRIINHIDRLDIEKYFTVNMRPTRHNPISLIKPRAQTSNKQYSFSHRVVNLWNSLPAKVVISDSINSFKNNLEEEWRTKMWKYEMVYE